MIDELEMRWYLEMSVLTLSKVNVTFNTFMFAT